MVQWLRLCSYSAGGMGSIPGRGTKIPRASWHGQKKKKKYLKKKGKPEFRKKVHPAAVIWQQKSYQRKDGMFLYFEDNTGIIVNSRGKMKGSAITGPVAKECADLWPRIASNASSIAWSFGVFGKKGRKEGRKLKIICSPCPKDSHLWSGYIGNQNLSQALAL